MERSIAASGELYGAQWDDAANVYQSSIGLHAKKGHANVGPGSGSTSKLRRKFVQEDDDGASVRSKASMTQDAASVKTRARRMIWKAWRMTVSKVDQRHPCRY